jgi:SAM-dependent methyltransferase
MHREQTEFVISVKNKFKEKFVNSRVLDIGSLDINGNNLFLFENCEYIGIDIGEGKNVDVVCRGHEYKDSFGFDVVISTECFEHDEFWKLTIPNAVHLTKPNGLFLFTCATTGRLEHGTNSNASWASPYTSKINDYYMNLTENDIRGILDVDTIFSEYQFSVNYFSYDLYFWGMKK